MDGSAAIERNRVALVRIVAALAAMAGFALGPDGPRDASARKAAGEPRKTLPRHLWRAVLRLLRPAESAARRLVIAAARGIVVQPPRPIPNLSPQVGGGHGSVAARSPSPLRGFEARSSDRASGSIVGREGRGDCRAIGGLGEPEASGGGKIPKIALPLFDRLRRVGPRPLASRDLPRICVPGWTPRLPVPVRHEPSPDDPVSGARLALRLDALARALDDLPKQARRFARWQARVAAGAQNMNPAAASSPPSIGGEVVRHADRSGGRPSQPPHSRRFRRLSPLRGGPPPGGRLARYDPANRRRHDIREVDEILAHAHELALFALEHPDTS